MEPPRRHRGPRHEPNPRRGTRRAASGGDAGGGCATPAAPFESDQFEYHGFDRGPAWFRLTIKPVVGDDGEDVSLPADPGGQGAAAGAGPPPRGGGAGGPVRRAEHAARWAWSSTRRRPGAYIYINPTAVVLGGRAPDELRPPRRRRLRRALADLFAPTATRSLGADLPLTRALAGEATREVEVLLRLPDGSERDLARLRRSAARRGGAGGARDGCVLRHHRPAALERALIERTTEAEHAAGNAALREEESRALREMGRALVSSLEPEDVLRLAGQNAMELLGARGSFFASPVPGPRRSASLPRSACWRRWRGPHGAPRLRGGGGAARGDADYNAVERLPAASPLLPMMQRVGARNLLLVPVRAYGEALGVLGVVDRAADSGGRRAAAGGVRRLRGAGRPQRAPVRRRARAGGGEPRPAARGGGAVVHA